MAFTTALRLNMTGLQPDPRDEARRYQAALDMAAYVDAQGFDAIALEEHHGAENGWLPSPLTMAAAVAARTQRVRISVTALLVTLYDPVRLAEDIAVLDLISNGRFSFVAGSGYRLEEYHAVGKQWAERGRLMDEAIDTLLKAWRGEPFDYRGQRIRVTPVPQSRPHPLFFLGGMSAVAARRAARFGLPFYPPFEDANLTRIYQEELARHGKRGFVIHPGGGNTMLVVAEDPEQAWERLGPCFLREMREYSGWRVEGIRRPADAEVETIEDLRRSGRFAIMTPADARELLASGSDHNAVLHPLAGGVPLDEAWASLRLFVDAVLRPLRGGPDAR
jgi:alkanesulfonate monooxygenase SsuD/methylene tetrahydromethanopterin reductase-like flavin-dependent oxidoreductase (luciferase family)